jgi:hypothetical protein
MRDSAAGTTCIAYPDRLPLLYISFCLLHVARMYATPHMCRRSAASALQLPNWRMEFGHTYEAALLKVADQFGTGPEVMAFLKRRLDTSEDKVGARPAARVCAAACVCGAVSCVCAACWRCTACCIKHLERCKLHRQVLAARLACR